jgi:hypothetical protein
MNYKIEFFSILGKIVSHMKTTKDLNQGKDEWGSMNDDDFDPRKAIPLLADDDDVLAVDEEDEDEEDDDAFNDIDEL